ncbi:MAG: MATE family efflux transporter [Proteobacteria bacterium]|nr:MATE family efflux transporter [Pseudomonadota bacterium]
MNIPLRQNKIATSSFFIEKSRLKAILTLSLPILIGMFGFSLVGLIDIAMVGRLGDAAQASLGMTNTLFFLLLTVSIGLGSGVQTLVAMRMGEGNINLAGYDLNAGLLLGGALGLALMILAYLVLPFITSLISHDPEVAGLGVAYLRARLPQLFFLCLSLSFRFYWNGTNRSQLVMLEMSIVVLGNILFNYLLIFGNLGFPRLEVVGAGLSSVLASGCAFLVYLILGMKHARKNGFLHGLPQGERIRTLVRLSIPMSISKSFLSLSTVVMFIVAGLMSTKELAAFNVITNIMITILLLSDGMGIAVITFVGQAVGRKDVQDAKKWGWDVAKIGSGLLLAIGLFIFLFPQVILPLFIVDAATAAIATLPLKLSGLYLCLMGFCGVLTSALVGAGATKAAMVYSLAMQWCVALPLQWLVGIHL